MESERVDELIAGYALDALSESDEHELEEHLRRSPEARERLAALQEAASSLAFGVDAPAPPDRLRERILAGTKAEPPSNVVPLRRRWVVPALSAAAAAAAGVAIGLAVWGSDLSGDLSAERSVADRQAEVLALFTDPGARHFEVEGANGTLVVDSTGDAGLALANFEPAPEGMTYQVWVIEGEEAPVSAGTFEGGGEQAIVPLTSTVPPGATVAVTIERDGGVEQPTSNPLFTAATV
jgi:anti-sigma-K factor RskA